MALQQGEVNKIAVMAAILTKDRTHQELEELLVLLATEQLRDDYVEQFRAQIAGICNKTINDLSHEFVRELIERIYNNVELKLSPAEGSV